MTALKNKFAHDTTSQYFLPGVQHPVLAYIRIYGKVYQKQESNKREV